MDSDVLCRFGIGLAAILPFFVVIAGGTLDICHLIRKYLPPDYIQVSFIIYVTTFIQWSIGGVFDSGFVLVWAFCGPIIAPMFFSLKHSMVWLLLRPDQG